MRADRGSVTAAGFALGLVVCMFAFAWYGVDGIPGRGAPVGTENGWEGLPVLRWLALATVLAATGAVALGWRERAHRASWATGGWVAGLGLLTFALLSYRVLIDPPSAARVPDQKLGAVLGVLMALGITLGGWDSLRAQRLSRPRGARTRRPEPGRRDQEGGRRRLQPGGTRQEPGRGARISP